MLKKSLSAALSAALIVACTPLTAVQALAANTQSGPRLGSVPTVTLNAALPHVPGSLQRAAAIATIPSATIPSIPSANVSAAVAMPAPSAAAAASPAAASAAPAPSAAPIASAVGAVNAPKASAETGSAVLSSLYEGSRVRSAVDADAPVAGSVSGQSATLAPAASRSESKSAPAIERTSDGGSLIGISIGAAAVVTVVALISKPFRALLQRAWNAALGMLGLGVKKMETPEVMAQRIVDQLNAAKPVYNRKVQDASTMVEKLKLQISSEKAKSDDLEKSITAILSDSDPNNDVLAEGMLKQQKILQGSIASSTEQLALAETTLANIKDERARFFAEREEMIAKINAKLTQAKAAEIRKQMADLKGGFQVGDLKDNMDKFEQAVDDSVAAANGAEDSVNSNPDEIIKKAKDSLRNKEVQDEIARRKAEIAAKNANNGKPGAKLASVDFIYFGLMGVMLGVVFAMHFPILGALGLAGVTIGLNAWSAKRGVKRIPYDLAAHENRAVAVGMALNVLWVGATGAFAVAPLIGALIAVGASVWHSRQDKKLNSNDGGLIAEVGIGAIALVTAAAIFSKDFRGLLARAWNATLGMLGIGGKKMETPEVMAQRIIDQLNAAKPVYNKKVADASTLVERLKLQVKSQEEKAAELDRTITALLSQTGAQQEAAAASMIKQKQTLDASTAATKEQLALAETTLQHIKDERASFFAEREETIAKINAKLTQAKAAEIRKQMADLKGGFQVGDLKDNLDKFEQAVDDKVAEANGAEDSVNSNPDQIIKNAKDQLRDQEIKDELARRKAEIAAKNANNGKPGAKAVSFASVWRFLNGRTPFGSYRESSVNGRKVRYYGWSLSGSTFLQSIVLGLVAGPIMGLLFGSGLAWGIGGMAAAPILVDLLKPTIVYTNEPSNDGGESLGGIGTLAKRFWNALLGIFGLGVKKMETPEAMAQRIVDQLNAAKPLYNRKVQDASTMVEKLKLQISSEKAKSDDLEKSITAILSDSDPNNDVLAEGMLKQQKILQGSIASSTEQLTLAETTLANIKDERARFFAEREEMIAKINAKLTQAKAAEIRKQMADLKGGFQVGDLKDNMDKFEQAVDDSVAAANGAEDSVNSNPDEIIKKAKDSLRNKEVQDEIARRKAEIAAKNANNGKTGGQISPVGTFAKLIGIGFALYAPFISSVVFAVMGLIALIMVPAQAQKFGRSLAVIGLGTLGAGALAMLAGAKLGLAVGAFGSGLGFVVPGALALAAGLLAAWRAHQAGSAIAGSVSIPAATAPAQTASTPSSSGFSLKPAVDLAKRFWNALLGIFGMGVKKMETPEVMAQRLIDQLNAAKPVYNQKVRDASTLVEKLKLQVQSQSAKAAELDKTITALLAAGGEKNETLAASALKQKQVLDASTAASQEQLAAAQTSLEHIKDERARFFGEREEAIAKINAGLTKAKAAEIRKQMADLKGGFQIGDLKDNMDRFEDAVNDTVAGANGAEDSVSSNPDEIIKKAKESMQDQDIAAEIARRKAEIAAKNK